MLRSAGPSIPCSQREHADTQSALRNCCEQVLSLAVATRNSKRNGAPYRHLLLYGPPGTGKTMVAKRLVSHWACRFGHNNKRKCDPTIVWKSRPGRSRAVASESMACTLGATCSTFSLLVARESTAKRNVTWFLQRRKGPLVAESRQHMNTWCATCRRTGTLVNGQPIAGSACRRRSGRLLWNGLCGDERRRRGPLG